MLSFALASCKSTARQLLSTDLPPVSVHEADINADGSLDRDEFDRRLELLYEIRDTDKDGQLSRTELERVNPDAFKQADRDDSGRLSKPEYFYLRYLDFKRLDTDDDQLLAPHELLRW